MILGRHSMVDSGVIRWWKVNEESGDIVVQYESLGVIFHPDGVGEHS